MPASASFVFIFLISRHSNAFIQWKSGRHVCMHLNLKMHFLIQFHANHMEIFASHFKIHFCFAWNFTCCPYLRAIFNWGYDLRPCIDYKTHALCRFIKQNTVKWEVYGCNSRSIIKKSCFATKFEAAVKYVLLLLKYPCLTIYRLSLSSLSPVSSHVIFFFFFFFLILINFYSSHIG